MGLDGLDRDEQLAGDLLVGVAAGDQPQHLALALGDLGPSQVSRALHEHAQAQLAPPEPPRPVARRAPPPAKAPFTVEGVGNLLSQVNTNDAMLSMQVREFAQLAATRSAPTCMSRPS